MTRTSTGYRRGFVCMFRSAYVSLRSRRLRIGDQRSTGEDLSSEKPGRNEYIVIFSGIGCTFPGLALRRQLLRSSCDIVV